MDTQPWYRADDLPPPQNIAVQMRWHGRFFARAMRVKGKSPSEIVWVRCRKDGSLQRLPPKRHAAEWANYPIYYRPIDPSTYIFRLPAPVHDQIEPRQWSSRGTGRFSAMGRQAARSARTVAALRSELGPEPAGDHTTSGENWWRDANAVVYQIKGSVSVDMAEARVLRFVAFLGATMQFDRPALPNCLLRYLTEEQIRDFAEAESQIAVSKFPQLVETENDRRDEEEAGRWFLALNPPNERPPYAEPWSFNQQQKLLRWRAAGPPLSWRRIGEELDMSHFQARHEYAAVIFRVHSLANGRNWPWHVSRQETEWVLRERKARAPNRRAA